MTLQGTLSKMKKPIIALDLDDVVVDHYETLVAFHNSRYGTNHTLADYISDHWSLVWGTDHEETERRAEAFQQLGIGGRTIKRGALEGIAELRKHFDLVIVSVRRKTMVEPTLQWVDEQFPGVFKAVRFVHLWEEPSSPSKAEICRELGADYLVDDSPKHCELAAEAGLRAVLFGNYAWNQVAELPVRVTRCADWPAVREYFDGQTD